jgi:hypothetical protein
MAARVTVRIWIPPPLVGLPEFVPVAVRQDFEQCRQVPQSLLRPELPGPFEPALPLATC